MGTVLSLDTDVGEQVNTILRSLRLTPQTVKERYFAGFHICFPVIAPQVPPHAASTRLGLTRADSAILVLAMLLVSHHVSVADPLYSTLRKLFMDVQDSRAATLTLVQAQLLIGAFEYARGWVEKAHVSVGICVRLAQIIGIDLTRTRKVVSPNTEVSFSAQEEAWNLWWGIMILDRSVKL